MFLTKYLIKAITGGANSAEHGVADFTIEVAKQDPFGSQSVAKRLEKATVPEEEEVETASKRAKNVFDEMNKDRTGDTCASASHQFEDESGHVSTDYGTYMRDSDQLCTSQEKRSDQFCPSSPFTSSLPSFGTPNSNRYDSITEFSPITPLSNAYQTYAIDPLLMSHPSRCRSKSPRGLLFQTSQRLKDVIRIENDILPGDYFDPLFNSTRHANIPTLGDGNDSLGDERFQRFDEPKENEPAIPRTSSLPSWPTIPAISESLDTPEHLVSQQETPCPLRFYPRCTFRSSFTQLEPQSINDNAPTGVFLKPQDLDLQLRSTPLLIALSDEVKSEADETSSCPSDLGDIPEAIFDPAQTPSRREINKHIDFSNPMYVRKYNFVVLQRPCLQCVVKNMPCDEGALGCSRCVRAGQGDMCLIQRDLGIDERIRLGFESYSFVTLVRRGESDELWDKKVRLEEELLEVLQERCDKANWILPVNNQRTSGFQKWSMKERSRAYEVDKERGREWQYIDWHVQELRVPI